MLENVAADDRVKPARRQRQVEHFDVADENLVETPPRRCRRGLVELDTHDLGRLPRLDRLAQPSRTTADVEDARAVSGMSANTSGRA